MGPIIATTFARFDEDVIAASRDAPVLVDFWASWCGPCRSLAPILENVATALAGRARVVKVDTDAEQALAARYQIRSIPTVMLFRNGAVASQFSGVQPERAIRDWVEPYLAEAPTPAPAPAEPGPDSPEGLARVAFAAELAAVEAGNSDLDALYADGLKAAIAGAHERAADAFLNLTIRSRAYRDDAGRLALLRLFELLGADDALVRDFRRRLSQALN